MRLEQVGLGGAPVIGLDNAVAVPTTAVAGSSPWALALATSVFGAATGWVIEEVARKVRRKRR